MPLSTSRTVSANEKSRESQLRQRAKRFGFQLKKSRSRLSADNQGEFMLVNIYSNAVAVGDRFDASLDDIEEFLS